MGLTPWIETKASIQLVLHSLALRDVVTLWVESVFILDRNEGLAFFFSFFPGVSSWVSCRFQFLWQSGHWSCLTLLYITSSFGWVHHVSNVLPFRILLCGFSYQSGLFSFLVAIPWGEPICVYSHIGVQFPANSDGCLCGCV